MELCCQQGWLNPSLKHLQIPLLCRPGDLHRPGNLAADPHLCNTPDINPTQSTQKTFWLVFLSVFFFKQHFQPPNHPPTLSTEIRQDTAQPSTAPPHPFTRSETLRLRKHWTGSENTHVKSNMASASTNTATIASNWRSLIICKHARSKHYHGGKWTPAASIALGLFLVISSKGHVHPNTSPRAESRGSPTSESATGSLSPAPKLLET